ncbi:MAG: hypothetical protein A2015_14755 [Spirochaetes bacterium GWF1_31_7]|nr:MAG: hypothetical protein A2Y30_10440 [Spirochaetes bacterium GWE1_32_154]OHD47095.1 MAG: hypothetical protein A2Y29_02215 [Spirochaetes bacterium GWE2_31_10]OHD51738.1 MAG: hypothetical protein A2015_14755 [Spirochaetes bacterium GWF1_31_7]OHD76839.1 MAG: hypothetical protein A2355_05480 [Spirochaetes bacterium RIFOXYB1_FULL_32_8]HBD92671.1 hypothetical protein [Spirochaetia bacterium]
MVDYESDTMGYLDITFGPKWDYIPLSRNFIENFLNVNMTDRDCIEKITMSTSELLENAVKYSHMDGIRTKIRKDKEKPEIIVKVYNSVKKEDVQKLTKYIDELNAASDPFEFYVMKIREKRDRGGLGLARINCEGRGKLSVKYFPVNDLYGYIEVTSVFNVNNTIQ